MTSLPKDFLKVQSSCLESHLTFQVELPITQDKLVLVQGVNGLGKTTLFRLIKKAWSKEHPHSANFIHQSGLNVLEDLSLEDILALLTRRLNRQKSSYFQELYDEFSAKNFSHKPVSDISGGQKQIVKILLGIFFEAQFYFFDEPFQNLDRNNSLILKEFLRKLVRNKKNIFVIEHDHEYLPENIIAGLLKDRDGIIHYVV